MPGISAQDKSEMLRRLVASYEDAEDLRGAVAELEKFEPLLRGEAFSDLAERRVGLYMQLARDAETAGDTQAALEWLAKARAVGGAPSTAWTAAAEILLEEGRFEETEALATENLQAPAGTNAYVRARLAETQGDLPAAARYYKEALRADPEFPSANGYLGGVLAQMGDTSGADAALAKAAARGEGGVAAKYNLAIMKSKDGDYRGAIPLLEEVVREDPSRKDAYRALAAAYRKEKDFRKAAEVSQTLVDTFGPSGGDLYQLAFAQAKIDEYGKAAENYAMVAALEPENFNAFYGLGLSLSKLDRNDEAVDAFTSAVELEPDNEIAMFNLALALQKAGRYEDAIDAYLEASDLKETTRSYTNIAICYQNLGDKDAADEYYRRAHELK
jgi:tetratricopeptide (TPR) repeat protein